MRDTIKPMWETPENENGGSWVFDVKGDEAEQAFIEIAMAAVGERVLQDAKESFHEICGLSFTAGKGGSFRIKIWNRDKDKEKSQNSKVNQNIPLITQGKGDKYYYRPHQKAKGGKSYGKRGSTSGGGRRR